MNEFLTRFPHILALVFLLTASASLALLPASARAQFAPLPEDQAIEDRSIEVLSLTALIGSPQQRREALNRIVERGGLDLVPTLVLFMRIGGAHVDVADALYRLTGEQMNTWRDAMLWQEAHPEVIPHESYRAIKLRFFSSIDDRFLQFFDPEVTAREQMRIRLEEITWGGVRVDGIPSLDNPGLIDADDETYMLDSDLVFGVEINGDVRAYPLRIMGWHEMFNEVIGGVPVALAYCTLCGAGILFETQPDDRAEPFVFGSSGFLYRSNKLMFDRETNTLWNQFTGEPVVGPLAHSGLQLKIRPVTITSWKKWKERHPQTKILSLNTGHFRNYDSGFVYREYFASPELMFPTIVRDETQVKRKEFIFGIREFGAAKAWPVEVFRNDSRVINDRIGNTNIVLIGDAETRTVRAYQRGEEQFDTEKDNSLQSPGGLWQITEDNLIGPNGETLPRVPGHIAYWFAWDGYLGVGSELYEGSG
ncbi:DUF3179 domain-containing protein [Kiloniella sp. b19]|uniref:DUF3179 domain-containing protein n=1 Tax=Kiloniella sp. GXU_MW_B19 TaxID=3141326 RepID=UPI0031DFC281